jgi:hypothetical protein
VAHWRAEARRWTIASHACGAAQSPLFDCGTFRGVRDRLMLATAWLNRGGSCSRALGLLLALIMLCITATVHAAVDPTVNSKPSELLTGATALRHEAESSLRVPHDRRSRRLGLYLVSALY